MKILVIDIGGTNLKIGMNGAKEPIKVPSGPTFTPSRMAADVKKTIAGQPYDAVSIGYPGPVADGRPAAEPKNLATGWVRFDYDKAFGKPVRIINDAAMQALGSYQGGRMLFLGLGTGLGTALVADGVVAPLELAHLPYRNGGSYEDYVGLRGYERMGRRKWEKHVAYVVTILKHALQVDYVMLGGGQTKRLKGVPEGARVGDNANAIEGGVRLWSGRNGVPVSAPAGEKRSRPRVTDKARRAGKARAKV